MTQHGNHKTLDLAGLDLRGSPPAVTPTTRKLTIGERIAAAWTRKPMPEPAPLEGSDPYVWYSVEDLIRKQ